ncbi:hypothetical protein [Candidatus Chromulinivorax destructor]|uniref:Uncharacterized protein n=1 Tax=Candidatus Chromulinivorax destructor TaxID=2066483 RepID=A0A345ZAB3_9BACT|nr:hypothetical protein [Candidatus Chromulinivorax destructor]AXK60230.1 hypothetical protein C0J27_00495 [Candidatus Chromulinivorax destructor]
MKNLITIALGVALGIAGYVFVNRYLHTHSATVVVQSNHKAQVDKKTAELDKKIKDIEMGIY